MTAFKVEVQTHFSLLTQIADSVNQKLKEVTGVTKDFRFRTKRGLINGIGSIFKSITGNLDSSDGDYYNECINKINRDERELENLLKSQISVTTSVIKNFNSTIQKLQVDEDTFNTDISEIKESITDISDVLKFYETQAKTLSLCESLMESYVFLENSLNDILEAITFARLRILHTSIITPRDLIASLQEISRSLSKNNLPLPTYLSYVARYLDIIDLEAYQSDGKIVFILKIPLIEPEIYTLYHIYPIPILDNRTGFHHILPTTQKYIARDDDSLLYTLLQHPDHCKPLDNNARICSDLLQYPIDSDSICEAQLLKSPGTLPKTCQASILLASDYNVQELDTNYWLITISASLPVTIRCDGKSIMTKIINTNTLMKLQPTCSAFVGSTRLHAKYLVEKYKNITYRSHPVEIPYDCCKHLPMNLHVPELKPLKLSNINADDLNVAQHRLNQFSDELDRLIQEPFISKHSQWFTILTIVLIAVLVTIYICCKCRRRKPFGLCLTNGDDPPPPDKSHSRFQMNSSFRKFLPKRRNTIRLDPNLDREETTSLRNDPIDF